MYSYDQIHHLLARETDSSVLNRITRHNLKNPLVFFIQIPDSFLACAHIKEKILDLLHVPQSALLTSDSHQDRRPLHTSTWGRL